jgi:hypothetical protein
MSRQFGIRMGGCETPIENLIIDYLNKKKDKEFKYLEIGAAGCVTMRAVYDILKENIKYPNWKIIGVDIDGGWSIDWNQIKSKFDTNKELEVWMNRLSGWSLSVPIPKAQLWIDKNPRALIKENFNNIDICFIDGCHGLPCFKADFLAVE